MHSPVRWNNKMIQKAQRAWRKRRGDFMWPVAQGWLHNGKELYLVTKNELSTENDGGGGFSMEKQVRARKQGPFYQVNDSQNPPSPQKKMVRWKIEKV